MTLEEAKGYAEAVLRQAGYTGPVEWLPAWSGDAVRFFPDERVEVYVDSTIQISNPARFGYSTVEVTFEAGKYFPMEGPAHRAATVAMLAEVLHGSERIDYRAEADEWAAMSDEDVQWALEDCIYEMFAMQNGIYLASTELARRKQSVGVADG